MNETAAAGHLVDPDLHASGAIADVWAWLRRNDPVHWHPEDHYPSFWSLTRYDDVRAVYRDTGTFSSARGVLLRPAEAGADPGGGLTLALSDPPRHRNLRTLIARWFTERSARSLEDEVRASVRDALAIAFESGECDFAHDVAARLTFSVICRLMGVPESDVDRLFSWTEEAFAAARPLAADHRIMQYLIELMDWRAEEPCDDIMSALVRGTVDRAPLDEFQVLLNCENLIGATENAGLSMATALVAFLAHPDEWRRLQEDRSLLAPAVEEMLRWASSATHSMRTATRAVDLHGRRIEAGDRVVLWLPSANRDAEAFADPQRFDISRRPNRHLALSVGEHVCIGSALARSQARVLYDEMLTSVADVELAGPIEPLRSIAVNGPAHLPVVLHAR